MEFIKETVEFEVIEVGDLVKYNGNICIVAKHKDYTHYDTPEFPYLIINLDTGMEETALRTIEGVHDSCSLVSKNESVKLKY